jgi:hypothetical protein
MSVNIPFKVPGNARVVTPLRHGAIDLVEDRPGDV